MGTGIRLGDLYPELQAARDLVRAYEEQQAKGLEALQRVGGGYA